MQIKDGMTREEDVVHSFLMIGQSNMAGRGEFADVPVIRNRLCYMLRMGRWQIMREPVNPDRDIFETKHHSGTSLAASFANEYAIDKGEAVGLIPCADGDTAIDDWMPGSVLFDHAVLMTRLAVRSSTLSGIIWHQGESDCRSDELLYSYKDKFITMMTSLRRELGDETLPVVIGELSEDISPEWRLGDRPKMMNEIFKEIERDLPFCRLATSDGLTLKPDGVHFDAVSSRVFGKRYYEAFCELTK